LTNIERGDFKMEERAPLLELRGICKYFGGIHALENVDFAVYPQEIIALVGDNGAGKSTLIKIIAGVHSPTRGEIYFQGEKVELHSPQDARNLGIETVYQELALVETRDVPANFFLGREPTRGRWKIFVDRKKMVEETAKTLRDLGVVLPSLSTLVRYLSGGQRQSLAIGRIVPWGGKIIIMDEPTVQLLLSVTICAMFSAWRTELWFCEGEEKWEKRRKTRPLWMR